MWFVNLFVQALLRAMRLDLSRDAAEHKPSVEELRTIVLETGYLPQKHRSILLNLFDLQAITEEYLAHLKEMVELDLEVATEFLVLIAALLELKSRLMLPREDEELLDFEPDIAAEELLARMLEAKRYRSAALHLIEKLRGEGGVRFRQIRVYLDGPKKEGSCAIAGGRL